MLSPQPSAGWPAWLPSAPLLASPCCCCAAASFCFSCRSNRRVVQQTCLVTDDEQETATHTVNSQLAAVQIPQIPRTQSTPGWVHKVRPNTREPVHPPPTMNSRLLASSFTAAVGVKGDALTAGARARRLRSAQHSTAQHGGGMAWVSENCLHCCLSCAMPVLVTGLRGAPADTETGYLVVDPTPCSLSSLHTAAGPLQHARAWTAQQLPNSSWLHAQLTLPSTSRVAYRLQAGP